MQSLGKWCALGGNNWRARMRVLGGVEWRARMRALGGVNWRARMRVLGGAILLLATGCAAPPLVVVSDLANPPFATLEASGAPRGFEVDLLQALADGLERPLEIRRQKFEELLDTVASGQADIACATLGVTPERAERVRFSRPYYQTGIAIVVRVNDPAAGGEIGALAGRRVAASRGTTSERAVRLALPHVQGVYERKAETPYADMLRRGEVDAVVMDGPDAVRLATAEPAIFKIMTARLVEENYALALPLDRGELATQIDRLLAELERSGRLDELRRKHGID
ncbi:MAG: ABC transporter substrate-binding protein [Planctomycetota bacterium]